MEEEVQSFSENLREEQRSFDNTEYDLIGLLNQVLLDHSMELQELLEKQCLVTTYTVHWGKQEMEEGRIVQEEPFVKELMNAPPTKKQWWFGYQFFLPKLSFVESDRNGTVFQPFYR